ncbi:MAG: hypothetical protein ACYDBZ_16220 [Steroidobacteraceae bacterium]
MTQSLCAQQTLAFTEIQQKATSRAHAARLGADVLIPMPLRSIFSAAFYKLDDDARAAAPPISS